MTAHEKKVNLGPTQEPFDDLPAAEKNSTHDAAGRPIIPIYNQLELASSVDMSVGAILKGTATKPMTLFEKKAALINGYVELAPAAGPTLMGPGRLTSLALAGTSCASGCCAALGTFSISPGRRESVSWRLPCCELS